MSEMIGQHFIWKRDVGARCTKAQQPQRGTVPAYASMAGQNQPRFRLLPLLIEAPREVNELV